MAAKAEYTPGPWRVERKAEKRAQTVIRGGNGRGAVARLVRQGNSHDDANARLIAAAPELLEQLNNCLAYFNLMQKQGTNYVPTDNWLRGIREAIARATAGSQP